MHEIKAIRSRSVSFFPRHFCIVSSFLSPFPTLPSKHSACRNCSKLFPSSSQESFAVTISVWYNNCKTVILLSLSPFSSPAFRKAHPILRLTSRKAVSAAVQPVALEQAHTAAYLIRGEEKKLFIVFHAGKKCTSLSLPEGAWDVQIIGDRAGTVPLAQAEGVIQIPPISAAVLVKH